MKTIKDGWHKTRYGLEYRVEDGYIWPNGWMKNEPVEAWITSKEGGYDKVWKNMFQATRYRIGKIIWR